MNMNTTLPRKMAAGDPVPIEIGTRGTVGNLVMKEIEYFTRLESAGPHDKKHRGGSNFWPGFGFLTITWRRGKRKGGRFLPRMCTMVDVADHRLTKIPSFSYRNLKDDLNQFQV